MDKTWQLQAAKSHFSEVVERTKGGDPPFDDELVIERDRSPAREVTFE